MAKQFFFWFLFLLLPYFASAQTIQWQKTIGGIEEDMLRKILPTSDGGYLLVGYMISDPFGWTPGREPGEIVLHKFDSNHVAQWRKTYGGNGSEVFERAVRQTPDKGYILGITSKSNISGNKTENSRGEEDYWVVKLDSIGTIQWQKTIGGNHIDILTDVELTNDGGYLLGGHSRSPISGDKTVDKRPDSSLSYHPDIWLVKLNHTGQIIWQKVIGGNNHEYVQVLKRTNDGGFLVGADVYGGTSFDVNEVGRGGHSGDFWILNIDSVGNVRSKKRIGSWGHETITALEWTADGGFIVGGTSHLNFGSTNPIELGDRSQLSRGLQDYWIVKFDSLHQVQWDKSFGGYNADLLHSLQVTADGGYILAGEARSELSGDKTENCYNFDIEDYWVIRLNSTGNILWQKIYGGYFKDEAYSIIITKDKGYLVGGFSASNISFDKTTNSLGGRDFWLLKLAENTVGLQQPNGSHQTLVYPNPANQVLAVNTGDVEHIGIQIYDMFGRLIQTRLTQNIETVLPVHDLVAGFYVVEILFANQTKVRKVFSKHH